VKQTPGLGKEYRIMTSSPPLHHMAQHRAGLVFGLGLSSLIINVIGCCSWALIPFPLGLIALILGILGWIFGGSDLKAMHSGIMDPSGMSMTRSGKVLSMISVIMAVAAVILFILAMMGLAAFVTVFLSFLGLAAAEGAVAG
jgi:hypothetical protein